MTSGAKAKVIPVAMGHTTTQMRLDRHDNSTLAGILADATTPDVMREPGHDSTLASAPGFRPPYSG